MATIYTHASANIRRTWFLVSSMFILIIGVFWVFSYAYQNPAILWFGVAFSLLMNIASYWYSDKLVLAMSRAKPADPNAFAELHRIIENLAITAGLPKPRVYYIDDPAPNAFATGRDKTHAAVAVTRGLLERLDRSELEGVLAHELSHIGNRDMLISTIVVVLAGMVAIVSDMFLRMMWFGGGRSSGDRDNRAGGIMMALAVVGAILAPIAAMLIRLAVSRRREFLADASGVLLTRYPEGLANALRKIAADPRPLRSATNATAHLFFENPFKADTAHPRRMAWIVKLFMTHPPIEDRIRALQQINV